MRVGALVRPNPNADGAAMLSTHVHPSEWWDDYVPHSVGYVKCSRLYVLLDLAYSSSGEQALLLGPDGRVGWMHATFLGEV